MTTQWLVEITADADVVRCTCPPVPEGVARGSTDPDPDCPNHGTTEEQR